MKSLLFILLATFVISCSKSSGSGSSSGSSPSYTVKKGSKVEYIVTGPDSVTLGIRFPAIAQYQLLNSNESLIIGGQTTPKSLNQSFNATKDGQKLRIMVQVSDAKKSTISLKIKVDGKVVKEATSDVSTMFMEILVAE